MNERQFKSGDKVYYPPIYTNVLTVCASEYTLPYPIAIDGFSFTREGKFFKDSPLPPIFHATPENHALLEQLYGVEFEKPPAKSTSRDIVKSRLAKGEKFVPCYAHDSIVEPNNICFRVYIQGIHEDGRYIDDNHELWEHVTPFDPATDEPITSLHTAQ